MKISEGKLRDLIRQKIAELSSQTKGKTVTRPKGPKDKIPIDVDPRTASIKRNPKDTSGDDQVDMNHLECWRNGGHVNPSTGQCQMGGSSGAYRK